jgi:ABC-type nitrate/sulfonate/bicarbonate transport system permease component
MGQQTISGRNSIADRVLRWDFWIPLSSVIVVILVWQAIATFRLINPAIFPGPSQVIEAALNRVPLNDLLRHVGASLQRVVLGFSLGAGLGILIGVTSGWYRWLGRIVWTPIDLLRPIPPLAWISLALIWFGLGESSKVFIIFIGAFFPIVTSSYKGMLSIDPDFLRVGQTMGLRGIPLLFKIAIPASLPDIATGIRVGWSLSFGSLVAAEILAAREGLGFMIMYARELGQIPVIVYGIVLIGFLNLVTDYLIRKFIIEKQLRWHFGFQGGGS